MRIKGYIHTIDNKPAVFDGSQICYMTKYNRLPIAKSLKQIRSEQQKTFKFREKNGFRYKVGEYGYQIIYIDVED